MTPPPLLPDSEVTDAQARLREAGVALGDVLTHEIGAAREMNRRFQHYLNAGGPEMAGIREVVLEGTTPPLRLRIYRPRSAGSGPLPTSLHIHGGGMAVGTLDSLDRWKREIADETGYLVVGLEYALAPEHPFPTALHQVLAALRWLRDGAADEGVDGTRLAVGGDSAGGNLALSALMHLRGAGEALPKLGVIIYGMLSGRLDTPSHRERGDGRFGLSTARLDWFWSRYAPEPSLLQNPAVAPLHGDVTGLPKLLLLAAALDPLLDDTLDLAAALKQAGAPHSLTVYDGVPHGFIGQTALLSKANAARREVSAALKAVLA